MITISKEHYQKLVQTLNMTFNNLLFVVNSQDRADISQYLQKWNEVNLKLNMAYTNFEKQYQNIKIHLVQVQQQNQAKKKKIISLKQENESLLQGSTKFRSDITKTQLQNNKLKDYIKKAKQQLKKVKQLQSRMNQQQQNIGVLKKQIKKYKKLVKMQQLKIKELEVNLENQLIQDQLDKELAQLQLINKVNNEQSAQEYQENFQQ